MKRFILDTSLFVNPAARTAFGKTPQASVNGFVKKVKKADAEFFMPPSIFKELSYFAEDLSKLETVVKKRAPNIYSIYLPAAVFHEIIDDVRRRMNKGLRLAEEFARDNRPDNDEKLRKLREKYREAVRTGIVDSQEDFEIILLAYQLEATIITLDEGIIRLANRIGVQYLEANKFPALLKTL